STALARLTRRRVSCARGDVGPVLAPAAGSIPLPRDKNGILAALACCFPTDPARPAATPTPASTFADGVFHGLNRWLCLGRSRCPHRGPNLVTQLLGTARTLLPQSACRLHRRVLCAEAAQGIILHAGPLQTTPSARRR